MFRIRVRGNKSVFLENLKEKNIDIVDEGMFIKECLEGRIGIGDSVKLRNILNS